MGSGLNHLARGGAMEALLALGAEVKLAAEACALGSASFR